MTYLVIFKLQGTEFAASFKTRTEAEQYVKDCAKAANKQALKNRETNDFIIAVDDGQGTEIDAKIQEVDAKVKYELDYDKDGERVETSYYASRKAAVTAAHKILDQYDFEASTAEDQAGRWAINNSEKNLKVNLQAKLVIMGSDGDNVVSSYACTDAKRVFENLDIELAHIAKAKKVKASNDKKDGRKKGLINLGIGAGIAILGGIMSLVSYNNAKAGETYTIYTGLIAIGVVDAIIGLYYLINPKAANK